MFVSPLKQAARRCTCLDPYIHLTTDITVATYYATPGSPILVLDMAAIESFCDNSTVINLTDNVTRAQHLPPGSFGDTWAIQSREILIAVDALPFTTPQGIPLVTSAKTSVLAHAVFQGFTCRNFFNMPEFKFRPRLNFFIQNGMFRAKNEQTAC